MGECEVLVLMEGEGKGREDMGRYGEVVDLRRFCVDPSKGLLDRCNKEP